MRKIFAMIFALSLNCVVLAKGLVVSIHPLYLIAQDVTKGVETPILLLSPQQSGHDIQLTPKNRQQIQNADLVLWLGPEHEAPLKSVLQGRKNSISILDSTIIKTLPLRDVKGQAIASTIDTHVWLEPNNAVRIAFFIAALRSQQYPEHKAAYWQNAREFSKRMYDATQLNLNSKKQRVYWAYHDAYQYMERALNLKFAGALSVDHDLSPTAAQIQYLLQHRSQNTMCLLAEYYANQGILDKLQPLKTVSVDEAMSQQQDFVTGWLKLANRIQQCLS